jgi:hypothetical protein
MKLSQSTPMLHAALLNKQLNKETSAARSVFPRTFRNPTIMIGRFTDFSLGLFGEDSSDPQVKIKKLIKSTERSLR